MAIVLHPDFCRQEHISAGDAGSGEPLPDVRLIAVDLGRVDMTEPEFQDMRNHPQDVRTGHPEGPKPERRNGRSIGRNGYHSNLQFIEPGTSPGRFHG